MKYKVALLFVVFLFSLTAQAKIIDSFVGCWRFVKAVTLDGSVDNTWGPDPVGYLTYSPEGIMTVQIMRKKRTDDSLSADFFAYAGHFTIDDKKKMITYHLKMALSPEMVGKIYHRYYRFKENRLYLTIVESKKGQTFVWEKCVS